MATRASNSATMACASPILPCCASRADQDHPSPSVKTERRARHQQPCQQCDQRHRRKLNRLVHREGPPAQFFRHQFREIRVDGYKFDADTDAREEAPQVQSEDIVLKRHHHAGGAVPKQRKREDGAPSKSIRDKAEERRSDE